MSSTKSNRWYEQQIVNIIRDIQVDDAYTDEGQTLASYGVDHPVIIHGNKSGAFLRAIEYARILAERDKEAAAREFVRILAQRDREAAARLTTQA